MRLNEQNAAAVLIISVLLPPFNQTVALSFDLFTYDTTDMRPTTCAITGLPPHYVNHTQSSSFNIIRGSVWFLLTRFSENRTDLLAEPPAGPALNSNEASKLISAFGLLLSGSLKSKSSASPPPSSMAKRESRIFFFAAREVELPGVGLLAEPALLVLRVSLNDEEPNGFASTVSFRESKMKL